MQYVYKNIKPNEVLVGRKNKDLVQIYRKFVLDLKKPVKFRNRELVNTLVNNIEKVMVEYMKLYSKGLNIDKPLEEHMAQFFKILDIQKEQNFMIKNTKILLKN